MTVSYPIFAATTPADPYQSGHEALLFIMAEGHCIGIPTALLYFAEKAGIRAIAHGRPTKDQPAQDCPAPLLLAGNRALDIIAKTLQRRDALEREDTQEAPGRPQEAPGKPNQGPMARLLDRPLVQPPGGQKAVIDLAF
jgi:hypothetical protein